MQTDRLSSSLQERMVDMAFLSAHSALNSCDVLSQDLADNVVSNLVLELKNIGVNKSLSFLIQMLESESTSDKSKILLSSCHRLKALFSQLQEGTVLERNLAKDLLYKKGFYFD